TARNTFRLELCTLLAVCDTLQIFDPVITLAAPSTSALSSSICARLNLILYRTFHRDIQPSIQTIQQLLRPNVIFCVLIHLFNAANHLILLYSIRSCILFTFKISLSTY
ncbi:hypothetical protein L9F63_008339, partial [Diploptera punctata]